uniref:alcohol dehydrogenase catalytic domain-containing protein n=1 Tax=Mycobacterium sp. OAE908 TaxID=2817899 RepID=UPI0034E2E85E
MTVEQVTLDPPGPTEIRVRMVAVGLCHTDLHALRGELPLGMTPMVLGHEGSGIVEEVGTEVHGIVEGDHVALTWSPACGRCLPCAQGNHHRCVEGARIATGTQLDGTFRRHDDTGEIVGGMCMVGAFAEKTVVDQASAVVVDPELPFDAVALAACSVTGGFGAGMNAVRIRPGDAVLVVGVGGTGMSVIQAARLSGARQVIAADIHEWKLQEAKRFGATDTIVVDTPGQLAGRVFGLTATGVDHSFVCIGDADALAQAARATKVGGNTVVTALNPPSFSAIPLSPLELIAGQKTLIGSSYGSISQRVGIPETLRHYKNGSLQIPELVSRTYQLDDIVAGFEDLAAGKNIRGLIRFD